MVLVLLRYYVRYEVIMYARNGTAVGSLCVTTVVCSILRASQHIGGSANFSYHQFEISLGRTFVVFLVPTLPMVRIQYSVTLPGTK